jgi:uncharacterized protein YybS (DUF2232 family)
MFLNENSNFSFRKLWSLGSLLVYISYVVKDLLTVERYDIPSGIKWVIMTVVGFYFIRRGVDAVKVFIEKKKGIK